MLKEKLSKYNVILASGSPRRQNFLKELDIPFTVQVKSVDEVYPSHLKASEITEYLSELKSNAFTDLKEKDLLITSDTIVWFEGSALEKPKDKKEAFQMLKQLSGKTHKVYTSVCLRTSSSQKTVTDVTSVEFDDLTDEEISYYVKTYQPYDKAGSYGIQEWIGLIGVKSIRGSYFNVMGLPVHKLYKELMNLSF